MQLRYCLWMIMHMAISCTSHLCVVSKVGRWAAMQGAIPLSRYGKLIVVVNLQCWPCLKSSRIPVKVFLQRLNREETTQLESDQTILQAGIPVQSRKSCELGQLSINIFTSVLLSCLDDKQPHTSYNMVSPAWWPRLGAYKHFFP